MMSEKDSLPADTPQSELTPSGSLTPTPTESPAPQHMSDHCTNDPPLGAFGKSTMTSSLSLLIPMYYLYLLLELNEGDCLIATQVYISKPADAEIHGARLLLFLTNGTGVNSINNQIQADHFARNGFFVAMPDLPTGDSAPNAAAVTSHNESQDLLERIKFRTAESIKGFLIDMWLARHTPEKTMPIIEKVLSVVKETYADNGYTASLGTYVVGYCFGGKYALRLAATEEIVATTVAHGLLVTKEDIAGIKKPVSFACVENDPFFPDEVRDEGRRFLEDNNIEHEMNIYSGVPHGFGVYGSYEEEHIATCQRQAFDQFMEFFARH
ncbi:hypothetical protein RUND412_010646 [Rhizina undulata]